MATKKAAFGWGGPATGPGDPRPATALPGDTAPQAPAPTPPQTPSLATPPGPSGWPAPGQGQGPGDSPYSTPAMPPGPGQGPGDSPYSQPAMPPGGGPYPSDETYSPPPPPPGPPAVIRPPSGINTGPQEHKNDYINDYASGAYGANTNNAGNYGNNFVSLQQYMKPNQGTRASGDVSGAGTIRDNQGQQGPQNGYNYSMYGIDSSINQAYGGTPLQPYVQGGNRTAGQPSANAPGYDPVTGGTTGGTSTTPATGGGSSASSPAATGAGSGAIDTGLFQGKVGGLAPNANFVSLQNRMRGVS